MPTIPDGLSDKELIQTVFYDALRQRYSREVLGTSPYSWFKDNLPLGYTVLTPMNWIEGEVSNGGFSQFFYNRLEDYNLIITDAIVAYEKIGACQQADVLRNILPIFEREKEICKGFKKKEPVYELGQTIWEGPFHDWQKYAVMLDTDDQRLFWEDKERLRSLKAAWIRRNPEAFLFPDEQKAQAAHADEE